MFIFGPFFIEEFALMLLPLIFPGQLIRLLALSIGDELP